MRVKWSLSFLDQKTNLSSSKRISITIGQCVVTPSDSLKSVGTHFDSNMKLEKQITCVYKSEWYHLFQISKIKRFLMIKQTTSVIHAYVKSHIDQNNIHLIGLAEKSLKCLQHVQNTSAKLIVRAEKHDHVTSILISLHWLAV